jgi:hypothetical protein
MGEINDKMVRLPFPLFFISLLCFFYAIQKEYASHRHALFFTCMLAILPPFIKDMHGSPSTGYADIPLTLYYTIATIELVNWVKHNRKSDLILAALFIGFAIFTKREGMILWVILTFMIAIYLGITAGRTRTYKLTYLCVFIVLPLIMLIPWFHFSNTLHLPPWEKDWSLSYLKPDHISSHFYRGSFILQELMKNFFTTRDWSVLWIIFFLLPIFSPKKIFAFPQAIILLIVCMNILALVLAIFINPWDWWRGSLYDMHRSLVVNIPLVMYIISWEFHRCKYRELST